MTIFIKSSTGNFTNDSEVKKSTPESESFNTKVTQVVKKTFATELEHLEEPISLEIPIMDKHITSLCLLRDSFLTANKSEKLLILNELNKLHEFHQSNIQNILQIQTFSTPQKKALDFSEALKPLKLIMETILSLYNTEEERNLLGRPGALSKLIIFFNDYIKGLNQGANYTHRDMLKIQNSFHPPIVKHKKPLGVILDGFGRFAPNKKTTYTSIGFLTICKQIEERSLSSQQAVNEFLQRDCFNHNTFIIGSGKDYGYMVHWPSRLIEYYYTFDGTITKALNFIGTQINSPSG
jgi:hypothetical protein